MLPINNNLRYMSAPWHIIAKVPVRGFVGTLPRPDQALFSQTQGKEKRWTGTFFFA